MYNAYSRLNKLSLNGLYSHFSILLIIIPFNWRHDISVRLYKLHSKWTLFALMHTDNIYLVKLRMCMKIFYRNSSETRRKIVDTIFRMIGCDQMSHNWVRLREVARFFLFAIQNRVRLREVARFF